MAKDYYRILGVDRKADEKEVKRAYRKMARQSHPDINPNDKGAEARFKEINEAYQVLSDKDKRALYDQFGADYDKVPSGAAAGEQYADFGDLFAQAQRARGGQPGQPGAGHPGARGETLDPADFGDLFETLLGGQRGAPGAGTQERSRAGGKGGFGFGRKRGPQPGADVEQPLEISLGESVRGTQRSLQLLIQDPSTGQQEVRSVTVKIPAGVRQGAQVRVAGRGASGQNGGPPGDLFLRISLAPHKYWKREGDDLHIEVPVTFEEAALGAQVQVPTLNGTVGLKIPPGTQSGQSIRLSGRGVPRPKGGAGDQFVKVRVAVPKNLSPREEELIRELGTLRQENVRAEMPSGL